MKTPLFLACFVFASCSKPDKNITIPNTPRSEVPEEMEGQWLNGAFSMSEWWTYDGKNYVGNPYTRSIAFDFSENGDARFYLAIKIFDGYCSTEAFTYYKGTVQFNEAEHSFTLYPQQGNYRGFYSCASSANFDRPAQIDELVSTTYYYSMETDEYGKEWMVIRFSPDPSESGSYFGPATLVTL